jgi:DNA-binding NtrC family response regulator
MPTRAKIRTVIAKLEKQRAELKDIITALRQVADAPNLPGAYLSLDDHEKHVLEDALHRTDGNQSEAARMLKVSRDKVRYKMAKHGLKRR